MDIEKLWYETEWTSQARGLIQAIPEFPEESKIILLLRHSHRDEPNEIEEMHHLRLTNEGHEVAKKFGSLLPIKRTVRLFHSIIWRCQETAEDIATGFRTVGGNPEIKGNLLALYHAGTAPNFFIDIFKKEPPIQFMYRWVIGFYSPELIMPFQDYCQNVAKTIMNEVNKAPEKSINIYITHDVFLLALRFGWFAFPPDKNWIPFLGGFAFCIDKTKFLIFDRNQFHHIDSPYWWKNSI
jgi:broad specificity phosphatase PhoE